MSPFAVGNRVPDDGDEPVARWPWVDAGLAAVAAVAAVVVIRRKK